LRNVVDKIKTPSSTSSKNRRKSHKNSKHTLSMSPIWMLSLINHKIKPFSSRVQKKFFQRLI